MVSNLTKDIKPAKDMKRPGKQYTFVSKAVPEDTFSVVSFEGVEGISQLYQFEITLFSHDPDIDLKNMLKMPAVFKVFRDGEPRKIHGILSRFDLLHEVDEHIFYKAILVPRLWQSDLYHENQLFLDMTVPEIIKEILEQTGLKSNDYELIQTRDYPKWEYICQFRETDLNFMSRWMEREGFYYYFDQTDSFEKLIITDHLARHNPVPQEHLYKYSPPSGLTPAEGEEIRNLLCCQNNLPQKVILKDYNYRKPSIDLKSEVEVDPEGRGKIYLYGEHFKTRAEGKVLATIKAEELISREQIFHGESTAPCLCSGYYMDITKHYRQLYNQRYLITEVNHKGSQAAFVLSGLGKEFVGEKESSEMVYSNQFTAIPSARDDKEIQFRPERKAIKPKFYGTMNAKIDAAGDGQYAEIDEHGRYKVILPFDLSGKSGGKASRYIRMMQPYAGANYGMHFPLHKGVEVLLSFVDGDPDRPIINGAVPNPETMSPVTGQNQAQSMIRSAGGNELHFDDTKDSENMYMHGTKDANTVIGNDRNESVGNNEGISIGANKNENIGADSDLTVGANQIVSVGSNMSQQIGSNLTQSIGSSSTEQVASNKVISAGSSITIDAGTSITLKCGASTIHMNSGGVISINGMMTTMSASATALVAAPLTFIAGAALLSQTGGINVVSGGITRVDGSSLAHLGGAKTTVDGGTVLVQGGKTDVVGDVTSVEGGIVKIN